MTVQALWDDARATGHTPSEFDLWGQEVTTQADAVASWPQTPTPLALVAHDDFARTGALGASVTPSGHTWTVHSGDWTADNGAVRNLTPGSNPNLATIDSDVASVRVELTTLLTGGQTMGAILAWVDPDNWVAVFLSGGTTLRIRQRLTGTISDIATVVVLNPGNAYLGSSDYAVGISGVAAVTEGNLYFHAAFSVGHKHVVVGYVATSGATFDAFRPATVTGRTGLFVEGSPRVGTRFMVARNDGGMTA